MTKQKEYFVYKFLDSNSEIIYVGMTSNIVDRITSQHFSNNGHLPSNCYRETVEIQCSPCVSIDDAKIKERYLINISSPKYNNKLNNKSQFGFTIDDFNWISVSVDWKGIDSKRKKYDKITNFLTNDPDYNIFIKRCLKKIYGNFCLLHLLSGRWAVVWDQSMYNPEDLDILILENSLIDKICSVFEKEEDAIKDIVEGIRFQSDSNTNTHPVYIDFLRKALSKSQRDLNRFKINRQRS